MIHDWDITELNQARAARRKLEVAVLPVGAIEPHTIPEPSLKAADDLFAALTRRMIEAAAETPVTLPGFALSRTRPLTRITNVPS